MRQRILDLVHAVHQLLHLIVELVDLLRRHLLGCLAQADDGLLLRGDVLRVEGRVLERCPLRDDVLQHVVVVVDLLLAHLFSLQAREGTLLLARSVELNCFPGKLLVLHLEVLDALLK